LPEETLKLHIVDRGILSLLQKLIVEMTKDIENYHYSIALKKFQNFLWHEFCDHYIEIAKNRLYNPKQSWMQKSSQYTLYVILRVLTHLFSPFAPHLTEEIAQHFFQETMSKACWPVINENLTSEEAEQTWRNLKEAISTIRKTKSQLRLSLNAEIPEGKIYCQDKNSREILEKLKPEIREVTKAKRVIILER
jgi:valyl-tRNA synthetase